MRVIDVLGSPVFRRDRCSRSKRNGRCKKRPYFQYIRRGGDASYSNLTFLGDIYHSVPNFGNAAQQLEHGVLGALDLRVEKPTISHGETDAGLGRSAASRQIFRNVGRDVSPSWGVPLHVYNFTEEHLLVNAHWSPRPKKGSPSLRSKPSQCVHAIKDQIPPSSRVFRDVQTVSSS